MPVLPPGYGKICVSNQMTRGSILQAWGWRLFPGCLAEWGHSICINPPKASTHRLAFFGILPQKKASRSCDNISPNTILLRENWHSMTSMWAHIGPKFAIATCVLTSPDIRRSSGVSPTKRRQHFRGGHRMRQTAFQQRRFSPEFCCRNPRSISSPCTPQH